MTKDKIPKAYFCPLTGEMMNVPVVNQYGNSFEMDKYRNYVSFNKKDPINGKAITNFEVYTNFGLIDSIESFLEK